MVVAVELMGDVAGLSNIPADARCLPARESTRLDGPGGHKVYYLLAAEGNNLERRVVRELRSMHREQEETCKY